MNHAGLNFVNFLILTAPLKEESFGELISPISFRKTTKLRQDPQKRFAGLGTDRLTRVERVPTSGR